MNNSFREIRQNEGESHGSSDNLGIVAADGKVLSGSGDFPVTNVETGIYVVGFSDSFRGVPAVVATQNRYGATRPDNTDGVAAPLVSEGSATLVTGNSGGSKENRSFGFIVIGNI
jgi:hypothetical protein